MRGNVSYARLSVVNFGGFALIDTPNLIRQAAMVSEYGSISYYNLRNNHQMSELQCLIFDFDGTLVDSEEIHRVAFNRAFLDAGLTWTWSKDLYLELLVVTGGKERIGYYLEKFKPNDRPSTDPVEFISTLHRAKTKHFNHQLIQGDLEVRIGVRALLCEARAAGIRLAIATTTSLENVQGFIEIYLGKSVLDWFEIIAAGSCVAKKKPAPDIYQYVLEKLGLQANQCIALEDSENGLRSAIAAGVGTIITTNQYTIDQDFSAALIVVDSIGESGRPFKVTQGESMGATYLDLDLIRKLHNSIVVSEHGS